MLIPAKLKKGLLQKFSPLFLLTVFLPTLLAIIYYGFIASPVYVSESKFVIRSPEKQQVTGLGALLKNVGFSRSQDDVYSVKDYIQSRDALHAVDQNNDFRKSYSSPDIDIFDRFNGFGFDGSFEALYLYYLKKVSVESDSASAITTLTTQGYSPQVVYGINKTLLQKSEDLVNNINNNGRRDMVSFAKRELDQASEELTKATDDLARYRSAANIYNTDGQSTLALQRMNKLQDDLMQQKALLAQLQSVAPQNPQVITVTQKIATLQQAINTLSGQLTGNEQSFSAKAGTFENLKLKKELADKQYAAALASLEQAKNDAVRKQVYLEVIASPNQPDVPVLPKRFKGVITVLLFGLVLWGISSMLFAGVKEHNA